MMLVKKISGKLKDKNVKQNVMLKLNLRKDIVVLKEMRNARADLDLSIRNAACLK
jgi:hypothetical protein